MRRPFFAAEAAEDQRVNDVRSWSITTSQTTKAQTRMGAALAAAAGAGHPLLDSDNDSPAAPNAGTAFLRLFRFDD